jgi:protein-tyrosine phosphatase
MIDIHCHILPAVDDGAGSLEDALSMARIAVADGIRRVVATPHQFDWDCQALSAGVRELQRHMEASGILLDLAHGVELRVSPDLMQRTGEERGCTLNGSRYILLELPLADYPLYTDEVVFSLQLRGLVPILAHPERNLAIQAAPDLMANLGERGVLGQMTGSSLLDGADRHTRTTAENLLVRGLVQVLATDAHDAHHRAPRLSPAVDAAARVVGREQAEAMVTSIPEAILADKEITTQIPRPTKPVRRWRGLRLPWHPRTTDESSAGN